MTTIQNLTPKVVDKAERLLLEEGWCQGIGHKGRARCGISALVDAALRISVMAGLTSADLKAISDLTESYTEGRYSLLSMFNDASSTTLEDILFFYDELREFVDV